MKNLKQTFIDAGMGEYNADVLVKAVQNWLSQHRPETTSQELYLELKING